MSKVLFIGRTGSGKTTLCQWLHDQTPEYRKTQAVTYFEEAIDTPGEYLEQRSLYSALLVTSCDADLIALVADPTAEENYLPPGLAGAFTKPVIGVVTKRRLASAREVERAKVRLTEAGAREIFVVDTLSGDGLSALRKALDRPKEVSR